MFYPTGFKYLRVGGFHPWLWIVTGFFFFLFLWLAIYGVYTILSWRSWWSLVFDPWISIWCILFMALNCNWIFLLLITSHLWGEFNFELMALMELGILIHVSVFNVSPLTKDIKGTNLLHRSREIYILPARTAMPPGLAGPGRISLLGAEEVWPSRSGVAGITETNYSYLGNYLCWSDCETEKTPAKLFCYFLLGCSISWFPTFYLPLFVIIFLKIQETQ